MRYIKLYEDYNSHLVEVKPNRYLYHTSNPIFRDKIAKEGLIPKANLPIFMRHKLTSDEIHNIQ